MEYLKFDPSSPELIQAWILAIEFACKSLNFDIRCLDWFSYFPDHYINQKISIK
jgi:hypothetical protein